MNIEIAQDENRKFDAGKSNENIILTLKLLKYLLLAIFAGGATMAMAWWYLMPHGFPADHPRFWVNSVFPLVTAAACLFSIVTIGRKQYSVLKCLVLVFGTMTIAAGISGKFIFPISVSGLLLAVFLFFSAFTLVMIGFTFWILEKYPVPVWSKAACIFTSILIGCLLPWSQRAMDPATKPYSYEKLTPSPILPKRNNHSLSLSEHLNVSPDTGSIRLRLDSFILEVYPLLSFYSRSPDRCWTIFSPRYIRVGPQRSLISLIQKTGSVTLDYKDDDHSRLQIKPIDKKGSVRLEAISNLPNAVYSHLNSFSEIHISGTGKLALSFSPCPDVVEMKPSGYPVGKPARLAYLDANNVFHVVEAKSGEKGPYRKLTEGILKKDEPLRITIHVEKKAVCVITLHDWAKQVSTQLSPTAGWGLPENAIEFSLSRSWKSNQGIIFITLAGTSIGRGWDSVGHAPGTYRNTIIIEPTVEAKP